MRPILVALSLLLPLLVGVPAAAQTNLPGGVLTEEERTVIRDYFGKKIGQMLGRRAGAEKAADDEEADDDDDGGRKKAKKGNGRGKGKGRAKGKGRGKGLPPGLAKRSSLPPGLQRQLDERGALPPGLQTENLPADLEAKLPPIKQDFERVILDNDVVLIEKGTNRVLDILEGVVTGRGKQK
jgi:hypothetical protein